VSWAKLDDRYWMHPKVIAAGNVGAGIFARFLSYCGAYLTDGLVPAHVVHTIAGGEGDDEVLDTLARMGLIDQLESGGVHVIGYLEHNRSKAQIEADRATRRSNGARGGRPRSRPGGGHGA
jgi:hypothetical protein